MTVHSIDPVFDSSSKILILGSFPSVKSREQGFFYGHPQNRFWKITARIFSADIPNTIDEKINLLKENRVALWDVIKSCEIIGSADSSIKNVIPNDLSKIFKTADIKQVFVNGRKAESLYIKYLEKETGIKATALPSTSPANASWSENRLFEYWNAEIKKALKS